MFGYWFDFDLTTTTIIFSFRTNDKLNSFCTPYSFILQYFLDIKPTKWSRMNNKELIDSNAWLPLVAENCSPGVESDSNKKQKRKNNETILGLDTLQVELKNGFCVGLDYRPDSLSLPSFHHLRRRVSASAIGFDGRRSLKPNSPYL